VQRVPGRGQRGRRFPCATCHVQGQSSAPAARGRQRPGRIDYLMGNGPYVDRAAYPFHTASFLILNFLSSTDLKFSNGWAWHQPTLAHISVFILSSSPEHRDRRAGPSSSAPKLTLSSRRPHDAHRGFARHSECVPACVPVAEVVA